MTLVFRHPRLMRWGIPGPIITQGVTPSTVWHSITDHNRSPLTITPERIERKNRMADGTMRKYVIADKRTFTCSWDMLPSVSSKTVDGFWGGSDIEGFYYNINWKVSGTLHSPSGSFYLEVSEGDGSPEQYTVMFSDFSKVIKKRGPVTDLWQVSCSLEEV